MASEGGCSQGEGLRSELDIIRLYSYLTLQEKPGPYRHVQWTNCIPSITCAAIALAAGRWRSRWYAAVFASQRLTRAISVTRHRRFPFGPEKVNESRTVCTTCFPGSWVSGAANSLKEFTSLESYQLILPLIFSEQRAFPDSLCLRGARIPICGR